MTLGRFAVGAGQETGAHFMKTMSGYIRYRPLW